MWTKICDFAVDGHSYEILVTESGEFLYAEGEITVRAPSLNALKDKLRKLARSKPIAIPVTIADGSHSVEEIKHGVIIGIHDRTGQYLFKNERDNRAYSTHERCFRSRFTPQEEKQFTKLADKRDAAQAALNNWLGEREIDVAAELEKAREAPGEEPSK